MVVDREGELTWQSNQGLIFPHVTDTWSATRRAVVKGRRGTQVNQVIRIDDNEWEGWDGVGRQEGGQDPGGVGRRVVRGIGVSCGTVCCIGGAG